MTARKLAAAKTNRAEPVAAARIGHAPSVRALLDALPFACAAFQEKSGKLVAGNRRYIEAFSALPGYERRADLLHALGLGVQDSYRSTAAQLAEVRAPHTGRWYALHWSHADHAGSRLQVLTATDVSERMDALDSHKNQQEQLLFTSRMMSVGEMAATLAHELNQPLAAIVNYLNGSLRLLAPLDNTAALERALTAARNQAEHASAIIGRVREFVRAREPRRDAQSMASIIGTVLELLRPEYERLALHIDIAVAPDIPEIFADRVMIEQVLLNLVKNGIEAMREIPEAQRELKIEGRVNLDNDVEIRVHDRGTGLSQSQQEQLFSPFFTTKADGMGIGLAICRSIIEYHQGRLYFEPREGGGSAFCFTLPVAEASIDPAAAPQYRHAETT